MGDHATKLCDFTNVTTTLFIANPIIYTEIKYDLLEVCPGLPNLIAKVQFGGSASDDSSMYYMTSVRYVICKKFKNMENDIVKLKLFPFLALRNTILLATEQ
jgi:hypothetical protein